MISLKEVACKLEEAIAEEDWRQAKSCLNDIWDLIDSDIKSEPPKEDV